MCVGVCAGVVCMHVVVCICVGVCMCSDVFVVPFLLSLPLPRAWNITSTSIVCNSKRKCHSPIFSPFAAYTMFVC